MWSGRVGRASMLARTAARGGEARAARPRTAVSRPKAVPRWATPRRETRMGEVAEIQAPVRRPRAQQRPARRGKEGGERASRRGKGAANQLSAKHHHITNGFLNI
jgi:hypothetical protein